MQRSSRKGFLRTRWQLAENLIPIELMNVHLFHDESNFVAMQQVPEKQGPLKPEPNALYNTMSSIVGRKAEIHNSKVQIPPELRLWIEI